MMNTLRNKVQLIGNLGNDPEIIALDSGKKLANFHSQQTSTTKMLMDRNKPKQNGIISLPGTKLRSSLKTMSPKGKRSQLKVNLPLVLGTIKKETNVTPPKWSSVKWYYLANRIHILLTQAHFYGLVYF